MSSATVNTLKTTDGSVEVDVKDISTDIPIGVGQTWQDVTGQREAGAEYTNDTGRPIQVFIVLQGNNQTYAVNKFYIDSVGFELSIPSVDAYPRSVGSFIVPAGSIYKLMLNIVGSDGNIKSWAELR